MTYATLIDVQAALNLADGTDDALLTLYLARAQAAIDTYCRRTFEAAADSTRTFDAVADVDGRRLWLDGDLCAITAVTNGDGVTVAANAYVTEPRRATPIYALTLKTNSAVAWTYTGDPEGAISIAGRWAYSVAAPPDIVQACIMLASFYYNRRGTEGYASVEVSNAVVAEFDGAGIPAHIAAMLDPYRRLV